MLILYYFAAPAADLLVCSKGHEHATWGMYLDVRYFPYPKIFFSYPKIRRIWGATRAMLQAKIATSQVAEREQNRYTLVVLA